MTPANPGLGAGGPSVDLSWGPLVLRVSGSRRGRSHLLAELGPPGLLADREPGVVVRYGGRAGTSGRYKGTSWTALLSDPRSTPLELDLRVRGPFGLALTQSILVEPLLAAAAAQRGLVALPAAAFLRPDGRPVVVVAKSGAGKSSLALEAIVRGAGIVADDRVLVHPDGTLEGVPRRLRLYADQLRAYPALRRRLAPGARVGAAARLVLGAVSRGAVRLPILVDPERLGADRRTTAERPVEIVLLERSALGAGISETDAGAQALAALVEALCAVDREHLDRHGAAPWTATGRVAGAEAAAAVSSRWQGVPVRRIVVGPASDVRSAVGRLADAVGLR